MDKLSDAEIDSVEEVLTRWIFFHPENHDLAETIRNAVVGIGELKALREAKRELSDALYHLLTECKLDGLNKKAGFDCWMNNAEVALAKHAKEAA